MKFWAWYSEPMVDVFARGPEYGDEDIVWRSYVVYPYFHSALDDDL